MAALQDKKNGEKLSDVTDEVINERSKKQELVTCIFFAVKNPIHPICVLCAMGPCRRCVELGSFLKRRIYINEALLCNACLGSEDKNKKHRSGSK